MHWWTLLSYAFVNITVLFNSCFCRTRVTWLCSKSGWRTQFEILRLGIDALQIEALEPIWRQVAAHKNRKFEETRPDVVYRIPGQSVNVLVIPNRQVQVLEAIRLLRVVFEKYRCRTTFLFWRFLIDIYGKNTRTGSDLWWSVVEELGIVELVLANNIGQLFDVIVEVVIQDSQKPFWRLYWTRKVKFESKSDEDVRFKIHEPVLCDKFLLVFCEEIDHPLEVWWHGLIQLGGHQNADGWQEGDVLLWEVSDAQSIYKPVKNVGG